MKDWTALAAASGIDLPASDIERIVKPLQSLEEAFRPLANNLTIADEPATILSLEETTE